MLLLTTLDAWRARSDPRFVLREAGAVWAPDDEPGLLAVADREFTGGLLVAVTLDPAPGAVPARGVIDRTTASRRTKRGSERARQASSVVSSSTLRA